MPRSVWARREPGNALTEGLYGSVAFASPPYNFVINFAPIVQSRPTARRLKDLELLVARRDVEVMLRLFTYWCSESRVWRGPTLDLIGVLKGPGAPAWRQWYRTTANLPRESERLFTKQNSIVSRATFVGRDSS